MDTLIRIGIVLTCILMVIALLGELGVWAKLSEAVVQVAFYLPSLITNIAPYLQAGRSLCNMVLGFPVLVDVALWFSILSPIILGATKLTVFLFSKFAG